MYCDESGIGVGEPCICPLPSAEYVPTDNYLLSRPLPYINQWHRPSSSPQHTQPAPAAASHCKSSNSTSFLWRLSPAGISLPRSNYTNRHPHRVSLHFAMPNSLLDSPPQLPAAGPWGSLFAVQEPGKPRRVSVALPFAPRKMPAYRYGMKRNLEMCTEALGCETGGVDPAADDADEGVERKRKYREEETKVEPTERRARVLPPPLTTLAAGATRMRMVHERRSGRLEVYAVRASGMEAERSGGRLRLRLLPCAGCNAAAVCSSQQEAQEAEEDEAEEVDQQQRQQECVVPKYVRRERCLKVESGATAARCSIKWEQEQAAAFWVATT
ncbi:hypothetical protein VPH35_003012 [Triticum aestivum]